MNSEYKIVSYGETLEIIEFIINLPKDELKKHLFGIKFKHTRGYVNYIPSVYPSDIKIIRYGKTGKKEDSQGINRELFLTIFRAHFGSYKGGEIMVNCPMYFECNIKPAKRL